MGFDKLKHLEGSTRDLVGELLYYGRKEDEELDRDDIDTLYEVYPDLNQKILMWFSDELNKTGGK